MLDADEAETVRKIFGSSEAQVRRDHAISHILAAIQNLSSQMVFYGGTALSRTFLTAGRLSEDIDLYCDDRHALCQRLNALPELIEEEFPQSNWQKLPSQSRDDERFYLNCEPEIQIQIQVVDSRSRLWQRIPIELTDIHQRYSDVPRTKMHAPTFDGFVAMKASAWLDRRTARDLFDLDALSRVGKVSDEARKLVVDLLGYQLSNRMMAGRVFGDWQIELAHQTRLERTEDQCMARILDWWAGSSE